MARMYRSHDEFNRGEFASESKTRAEREKLLIDSFYQDLLMFDDVKKSDDDEEENE